MELEIGKLDIPSGIDTTYSPYIPQTIETKDYAGAQAGATLKVGNTYILQNDSLFWGDNKFGFGKLYVKLMYQHDYVSESEFKSSEKVVVFDYSQYMHIFEGITSSRENGGWVTLTIDDTFGYSEDGTKVYIGIAVNKQFEVYKRIEIPLDYATNGVYSSSVELFFEGITHCAFVTNIEKSYSENQYYAENANWAIRSDEANTAETANAISYTSGLGVTTSGLFIFEVQAWLRLKIGGNDVKIGNRQTAFMFFNPERDYLSNPANGQRSSCMKIMRYEINAAAGASVNKDYDLFVECTGDEFVVKVFNDGEDVTSEMIESSGITKHGTFAFTVDIFRIAMK